MTGNDHQAELDHTLIQGVLDQVAKRVVGQDAMVERLIISLLTGGHVLLEGVPGLAKTLTVRTLAESRAHVVQPDPVHARPSPGGRRRHRRSTISPAASSR